MGVLMVTEEEEEEDDEGEEEDDDKGEGEDDDEGEEEDDNKEEERGPRIWRETKVDGKLRLPGITEFIAGGYGSRREGRRETTRPVRRRPTVYTKRGNRQAR